ncbi:hypothetical protein BgAZ_401590 [Babesia gibsoni]|uniref:Uncharacterized protein n=1 Tax=Babesia gibsoni TaxID=33632 RepID=A0AAD8PCZ7_BABGI|nr:hypothetical protein BgAZ_401590 [Babesia gibsoni]
MIPKDSLFRLVKKAVKCRSVKPLEAFQDCFERHLALSLGSAREPWPSVQRISLKGQPNHNWHLYLPTQHHKCDNDVKYRANGELSQDVGIDGMKPFEVLLSYQLLELQFNKAKKGKDRCSEYEKCLSRLNALLNIATFKMQDLSFVKLSLILNSIANIMYCKVLGGELCIQDNTPCKGGDTVVNAISSSENGSFNGRLADVAITSDIGSSLSMFHVAATSRLMFSLWINATAVSDSEVLDSVDEGIGSIDSHSICMVLKYYLATKSLPLGLLHCIHLWLKKVSQISWRDKIGIVVHLSQIENCDAFSPQDLPSIAASVVEQMHTFIGCTDMPQNVRRFAESRLSVSGVENGESQFGSVVDVVLASLLDMVPTGQTSVKMVRQYINAIEILKSKGVNSIVLFRTIVDAIRGVDDLVSHDVASGKSNVRDYINLLSSINNCIRSLLSPEGYGNTNTGICQDTQRTMANVATSLNRHVLTSGHHCSDAETLRNSLSCVLQECN